MMYINLTLQIMQSKAQHGLYLLRHLTYCVCVTFLDTFFKCVCIHVHIFNDFDCICVMLCLWRNHNYYK